FLLHDPSPSEIYTLSLHDALPISGSFEPAAGSTFVSPMNLVWPWLVVGGLGAFHGINPATGWLFAVALGLHRKSRAVVLWSLLPIAIGHTLSIAVVAGEIGRASCRERV